MRLTRLPAGIDFWNSFAPWYEKWVTRGTYHQPILWDLSLMVEPNWRIIDIGAATGVLSIPLASLGCSITAIEPSAGMRDFLSGKLLSLGISNVKISRERWEDYTVNGSELDLAIACNSLHLTEGGIIRGMKKVFSTGAAYIALVTEINTGEFIDFRHIDALQETHAFLSIRNYRLDSSFPFENLDEVLEYEQAMGRIGEITFFDDRPVASDYVDVAVLWWERKGKG